MLDERDQIIMSELRQNARKKLTDIAKDTGIPTSTVHERVQRFIQDGLRLVTLYDYPKLHLPVHCWVLVKTRKRSETVEFLQESPFVNVLLLVNNGFDLIVECVFQTFKQQHEFIEELKGWGKARVHPVIDEIGRELADPHILLAKKQ